MSESIFNNHDGLGLAELVRKKDVSATELLEEAIERVEETDKTLHFLADKYYDFARDQIDRGLPEGPFTGVPFLRKDTSCTIEGLSDASGMKLLKDNKASDTDLLAQRYMDAGLVFSARPKYPHSPIPLIRLTHTMAQRITPGI